MTEPAEYLLGSGQTERERLLTQCKIYEPETRWLLDRVGIKAGLRVSPFVRRALVAASQAADALLDTMPRTMTSCLVSSTS